jgi:uncharacterized protein with GYD domain
MANVKYLPEHIVAFRQAVEAAGGRMPHVYLTMGHYDLVAIVEAPSDQICASISLGFCSLGNLRSETLKAFGEDELLQVVDDVPSLGDEFSRILSDVRPE